MRDDKIKQMIQSAAKQDAPDLKARIKSDPRFIPKHKPSWLNALKPRFIPAFSALSIILIMFFVFFTTPSQETIAASTIYMEINPAIQLDLDEEDQVIEIIALNDDAEDFIHYLDDIIDTDVLDAIDSIVEKALEKGFLNKDRPVILYDVVSENAQLSTALSQRIEAKIPAIATQHLPNLDMFRGNSRPHDEDRNTPVSNPAEVMRNNLIRQILNEFPDDYTIEDLRNLSITELRRILVPQNGPPSGVPGHNQR